MRIEISVYSSKKSWHRWQKLKQSIARRGISILDVALNAAMAAGFLLLVVGGMAADSDNLAPVFWTMGTGLALMLASWGIRETIKAE